MSLKSYHQTLRKQKMKTFTAKQGKVNIILSFFFFDGKYNTKLIYRCLTSLTDNHIESKRAKKQKLEITMGKYHN